MGLAVWNSTRLDRFAGSRILSMANNDPIDSDKRMQTIKISESNTTNALELMDINHVQEYQTMVHFLRVSLRLGHSDATKIVSLLVDQGVE